jgi:hypothetical protein
MCGASTLSLVARAVLPYPAWAMDDHSIRRGRLLLALLGAASGGCAGAGNGHGSDKAVACHIEYGGQSIVTRSMPVASSYDVAAIPVGSLFLFRLVVQQAPAEIASVKVYTYFAKGEEPSLIHLARFPYPPEKPGTSLPGFTGRQSVYEPVRGGELQYWCELEDSATGEANRNSDGTPP